MTPPGRPLASMVAIMLATAVALDACVAAPPRPVMLAPPAPSMLAAPGPGKDPAAFDADNALCQRSAAQPGGANIYAQCMISHGNVVQATPIFPPGFRRPPGFGPPAPY